MRSPIRERVDGLRNQPFARPVLARDQNVCVGRRDPGNDLQHGTHSGRFRNDVRRVPAQQLIRRFEPAPLPQRAPQFDLSPHDRQEPVIVPRLWNEIARPAFHRFHRQIDCRPRRHHHDRQRAVERLDFRDYLEPFLSGSRVPRVIQVHDQKRVILLFERLKNARERRDRVGLMSFALEQNAQRLQHIVLVVRDQDPAHQLTDEPRFPSAVNQATGILSRSLALTSLNSADAPARVVRH